MDDSLGMGCRQGAGRLGADPQDFLHRQRARSVKPLLEGAPGDVLHHEVRQPAKLAHRMDGHNVLVPDGRRRTCLAIKPPPRRCPMGQVRGEYLDRHGPVEGRVQGLEHHTHPALAKHLENLVRTQPAQSSRLVRVGRIKELDPGSTAIIGAGLILLGFQGPGCQTDCGACTRLGLAAQQACLAPELAGRGQALQLLAARRAGFQMGRQSCLFRVRQPILQGETQAVRVARMWVFGHDHSLLGRDDNEL